MAVVLLVVSTGSRVGGGSDRSPPRSTVRRARSSADASARRRAGRPTATASSGNVIPAGTSVPSPRNTRLPRRAPGMRIDALPISQRSPTLAPTTRHRWPNTVRRPIVVRHVGVPITTEFSSTAEPVPISTPAPDERITAPCASSEPHPRAAVPTTTADAAICITVLLRVTSARGYSVAPGPWPRTGRPRAKVAGWRSGSWPCRR